MVTLAVKVVPGASRDQVAGRYGDGIKVQVSAPPEAGKANLAVVRVLAEFFSLRADQVTIVRGQTQPRKVVSFDGLEAADLDRQLATLPR